MSSSEVLQPRYWRQPAKLFLLLYPEDGIWVPKHVGVFICVMYITSLRAFVGNFIDCRNMGGMNNVKIR